MKLYGKLIDSVFYILALEEKEGLEEIEVSDDIFHNPLVGFSDFKKLCLKIELDERNNIISVRPKFDSQTIDNLDMMMTHIEVSNAETLVTAYEMYLEGI